MPGIGIGLSKMVTQGTLLNYSLPNYVVGEMPAVTWGGRKVITAFGDSITRGAIAGSTDAEWLSLGYMGQIRTFFQNIFGDGGTGWVFMSDSRWSFDTTWSEWLFSPYNQSKYISGESHKATLTIESADNVDLFYYDGGTAGDFTYIVDGGSPVIVNVGTTNLPKKINIALGSIGSHTLEVVPGELNCILHGAAIYKGSTGLVINNISLSGLKIQQTQNIINSNIVPYINLLGTNLLILNMTANDFAQQTNLLSYENDINTALNAFKIIAPYIAILPPRLSDNLIIPQSSYEDIVKAKAIEDGFMCIDIALAWESIYVSGKMYDNVHPNLVGHTDMALKINNILKNTILK